MCRALHPSSWLLTVVRADAFEVVCPKAIAYAELSGLTCNICLCSRRWCCHHLTLVVPNTALAAVVEPTRKPLELSACCCSCCSRTPLPVLQHLVNGKLLLPFALALLCSVGHTALVTLAASAMAAVTCVRLCILVMCTGTWRA